MGRLLIALASFLLMLYLPTLIKTPEGDPYLVINKEAPFAFATYTHPYHALMVRISALTGPKEESIHVFARQDSHGNMYFSDKDDGTPFHKNQDYEVRDQFTGRLSFPPHWVWSTMLATWALFYILIRMVAWAIQHQYAKLRESRTLSRSEQSSSHSKKTTQKNQHTETKAKSGTSPFQVLGITEDASLEEIKAAYRKKIKAYHPDRVAHLGVELQEIAQKKSTEINRAYEMLQSR